MELPGGKEELQRTRDLLHHRLFERLQHLAVIVIWKTALFLGQTSFLYGQTITPLNLFGQLAAAE
ncbi:hypothetical protein D3C77_660430 [compost metagenome]